MNLPFLHATLGKNGKENNLLYIYNNSNSRAPPIGGALRFFCISDNIANQPQPRGSIPLPPMTLPPVTAREHWLFDAAVWHNIFG